FSEIRVVRYARTDAIPGDADASIRQLGALLGSVGAGGRAVSLAVSGFGTCHQLLSLPSAPPDVLRPVIAREMRRFYPDLFTSDAAEPILEYAESGAESSSPGGGAREFLVAAAPPALVQAVTRVLAEYGVAVAGWTIAPRALQRLHAVFGAAGTDEAVVLMLPGSPLLALFHGGGLRLFSEPAGPAAARADDGRSVGEMVDRAALFLRQQFRGARLTRVLVAGERESADAVVADLRSTRGLEVDEFGDQEPGALLALGAALDAEQPDRLSLLPAAARPLSRAEWLTRALAVASVVVLVAASAWWTRDAFRAEREARAAMRVVQTGLSTEQAATAHIREVVGERRSHAERAALLEMLARRHNRLPEVLWPLQAAAPAVGVVRMQVRPSDAGWQVELTAIARGRNGEEATDAVDALVRQLEAQLAGETVSLSQMTYAPPGPGAAADAAPGEVGLTFEISFTIADQPGSQG
ncbi:MAG TPA: hypothetical protein VFZ18_08040, partial [Longimicrobiaceae bacterium]